MVEMDELFEIIEIEGCGKVMKAKEDILPGVELLKEEPLLYISKEFINAFRSTYGDLQVSGCVAAYNTFRKLPEIQQQKYLLLFGPLIGIQGAEFRKLGKALKVKGAKEIEICAKVASIYMYNAFTDNEGNQSVYFNLTRQNHSCEPNCYFDISGTARICRVILPVKKGEELTNSYNEVHNSKPTHYRRHRYLFYKQFSCHCHRCLAPGDDTRQFNCSDSGCTGYHLACQPLNRDPMPHVDVHYTTDLIYEDPYLLCCNVCAMSATPEYEQAMFLLESTLSTLSKALNEEYVAMIESGNTGLREHNTMFEKIQATRYPTMHSLSKKILRLQVVITSYITKLDSIENKVKNKLIHQWFCNLYGESFGVMMCHPNDVTTEAYQFVCDELIEFEPNSTEIAVAREYAQKAVRMTSLLHGRTNRNKEVDGTMCAVLRLQASAPLVGCADSCGFCGEHPMAANVTLSKCSKCKKTTYCSRGCQVAHWKLHKKQCVL